MDRDFRTYHADRVEAINPKDLERLLYPLLKADDRPTVPAMVKAVTPLLQTILDHNREEAYLEAIANGRYRPELLFPKDPEIIERIRQHPAPSGRPTTSHDMSRVLENIPEPARRSQPPPLQSQTRESESQTGSG